MLTISCTTVRMLAPSPIFFFFGINVPTWERLISGFLGLLHLKGLISRRDTEEFRAFPFPVGPPRLCVLNLASCEGKRGGKEAAHRNWTFGGRGGETARDTLG